MKLSKKKTEIFLYYKKNIFLTQKLIDFTRCNNQYTANGNLYLVLMVYLKRFGIKK